MVVPWQVFVLEVIFIKAHTAIFVKNKSKVNTTKPSAYLSMNIMFRVTITEFATGRLQ